MMYWRYGPQASPPAYQGGDYWYAHPMMGFVGSNAGWVFSIFCLVTWLLALAVLFALLRWLWFKGDNEKKRR